MHILIIGNGIAGTTAARFMRKQSDHEITMISSETSLPYSRTALMYIYMGHLNLKNTQLYSADFYKKNKINLIQDYVSSVDFEQKEVHTEQHSTIKYDRLILATGSQSNKFGWPGQDLKNVHGLYNLQDLDAMNKATPNIERAVIVGGGLIGIEMAEMFHSKHIPVTFLVREKSYWNMVLPPEESTMVNNEIVKNHIDLRLETELSEILSDDQGRCRGVVTNTGEEIACEYVGLTAGVHPNIDLVKDSPIEVDRGILVNDHLQTSHPDVYAIGDCAQQRSPKDGRRSIEAVWYTGKMMGEVAAYHICGHDVAYDPGIWFNSAKFFDIEYQVYGQVPARIDDPLDSLYWEHIKGNQSARIVYHKDTMTVVGFQFMGARMRHELCEAWIRQRTSLETVLRNLSAANFDPEFYRDFAPAMIQSYNQKFNKNISNKSKRGKHAFQRILSKLS